MFEASTGSLHRQRLIPDVCPVVAGTASVVNEDELLCTVKRPYVHPEGKTHRLISLQSLLRNLARQLDGTVHMNMIHSPC